MKIILAIALAAILSACASTDEKNARTLMQADVLDHAKAQAAAPLFELTCPTTGCVIASLKVANPGAAAQFADIAKVAFAPQRSEGTEIALALLGGVERLGGIGLIGASVTRIANSVVRGQVDTATAGFAATSGIASDGFAASGAIARLIPQPGAVTNTTVTASGPGAAASSGGNASGSAPTTTTTTTTTNTNSNNTNPAPAVVTCTGSPVVCTRS